MQPHCFSYGGTHTNTHRSEKETSDLTHSLDCLWLSLLMGLDEYQPSHTHTHTPRFTHILWGLPSEPDLCHTSRNLRELWEGCFFLFFLSTPKVGDDSKSVVSPDFVWLYIEGTAGLCNQCYPDRKIKKDTYLKGACKRLEQQQFPETISAMMYFRRGMWARGVSRMASFLIS